MKGILRGHHQREDNGATIANRTNPSAYTKQPIRRRFVLKNTRRELNMLFQRQDELQVYQINRDDMKLWIRTSQLQV